MGGGSGAVQTRTQLRRALRRRVLVQFERPLEPGSVLGYVRGVGAAHFMVSVIGPDMRPDGFQVFRLRDVRRLRVPHKHARFVEASLRLRGARLPRTPRVRLDGVPGVLRSASRLFPLVTIHRERVDPAVCQIGRVLAVDDRRVRLLEIDPDAKWRGEPREYATSEITRVDFGCGYEEALALVNGAD
jgi:hypothetical protein